MGPRQAGKTTLLKMIKEYLLKSEKVGGDAVHLVTFEDRRLMIEFERDPVAFISSYLPKEPGKRAYIMIDEFQYADDGGQKLKLIYDTMSDDRIKIIVTGSSSLDIKAKVGKYMVGRMLSFHLYPFNFGEYLKATDDRLARVHGERTRQISEFIRHGSDVKIRRETDPFYEEFTMAFESFSIWGGYPAVALTDGRDVRKKVLADIYNNYILKDVTTLLELATEKNLFLLTQYLATQIGNIVVYQNLGQASGLDHRKLKNHLAILEETFVCKPVRPFFRNKQKELSKNPKIYFFDLGFRNNIMEDMKTLDKRSDAGALIENACFIRLNQAYGDVDRINFWRTKSGAEVDFVMHVNDEMMPFEIKYSMFDSEKMTKSLASFIDTFKPSRALVLTKNFWGEIKRGKTDVVFAPVYYL
jgi:predicted AAA+ superfamily ATPase